MILDTGQKNLSKIHGSDHHVSGQIPAFGVVKNFLKKLVDLLSPGPYPVSFIPRASAADQMYGGHRLFDLMDPAFDKILIILALILGLSTEVVMERLISSIIASQAQSS